MGTNFGRVLALLRKEKGISQKEAAADLGISQALLSHYEKGVRECGLEFVVKTAEYYHVSCDYLLGRSAERTGSILNAEDLPEPESGGKDNRFQGSLLPALNKKLIANSLNVVYGLLSRAGSRELTTEASNYLSLAVYKVYRYLYCMHAKNPQDAFELEKGAFADKVAAAMQLEELRLRARAAGSAAEGETPLQDSAALAVTPEQLYREYPLFAGSLMNLVKNAEEDVRLKLGEK